MKMKHNRRNFIKRMGFITGSILFLPACSYQFKKTYRILSNDEASCLIALCEQIIPADKDPGATDAGVINFIDKQVSLRFPEEKDFIKKGVDALQASCQALFKKKYEELDFDTQTTVATSMEKNELPDEFWSEIKQSTFFNKIIQRTMQGFYGMPRHGGNKDYVSYRMLKLDYPLLVGQNRYRKWKTNM